MKTMKSGRPWTDVLQALRDHTCKPRAKLHANNSYSQTLKAQDLFLFSSSFSRLIFIATFSFDILTTSFCFVTLLIYLFKVPGYWTNSFILHANNSYKNAVSVVLNTVKMRTKSFQLKKDFLLFLIIFIVSLFFVRNFMCYISLINSQITKKQLSAYSHLFVISFYFPRHFLYA